MIVKVTMDCQGNYELSGLLWIVKVTMDCQGNYGLSG